MDKIFSVMGSFGRKADEESRPSPPSDSSQSRGPAVPSRDKRGSIASILNVDNEHPFIASSMRNTVQSSITYGGDAAVHNSRNTAVAYTASRGTGSPMEPPPQPEIYAGGGGVVNARPSRILSKGERSKPPIEDKPAEAPIEAKTEEDDQDVLDLPTEQVNGEPSATTESEERSPEPRSEFKALKKHRWADDRFEILVEWSDGEESWLDEYSLHADCPAALQVYWTQTKDGLRPPNLGVEGEVYNVFAVKDDRKKEKELLVEWVGFKESTWEPSQHLKVSNKQIVQEYFEDKRKVGKRKVREAQKVKDQPVQSAREQDSPPRRRATRAPRNTTAKRGTARTVTRNLRAR